jgi:hypothetical protein
MLGALVERENLESAQLLVVDAGNVAPLPSSSSLERSAVDLLVDWLVAYGRYEQVPPLSVDGFKHSTRRRPLSRRGVFAGLLDARDDNPEIA